MTENMKAFLDAISNNEELKEKVDEINKKEEEELKGHIAEYISLAKEVGITLTEEDFQPEKDAEMNDEELEAVTGGSLICGVGGGGYQCGCFVVGAVKGCGCVVVGTNK